MSFIEFQSLTELKKVRELEKKAKDDILKKAKESYEKKQWKEAIAKQKGENTWMLPSVNNKIDGIKKRKKEKSKKSKKEKKEKKKKVDSSSSNESEEEDIWVEKKLPTLEQSNSVVSAKRDQWMEAPSLFKSYTREEMHIQEGTHRGLKKLEERQRKEDADKPGSHARELNPYYQDGGAGLPEREASQSVTSSKNSTYDAGWLKKALARAQTQAKEEGKPLEEIAKTRWGSLEAFYGLLKEAENNSRPQEAKSTIKYSKSSNYSRSSKDGRDCYENEDQSRERHNEKYVFVSNSQEKYRSGSKDCRKGQDRGTASRKRHHSSSSDNSTSSSNSNSGHRRSSNRKDTIKTSDYVKTLLSTRGSSKKSDSRPYSSFLKPGDGIHKRSSLSPSRQSYQGNWKKEGTTAESAKSYREDREKLELPSDKSSESVHKKLPEKLVEKEDTLSIRKDDTKILSDKEMNQLAAKLTKAELLGNESVVFKLKQKLEKARAVRDQQGKQLNINEEPEKEVIVLTRTDSSGFTRPINIGESVVKKRTKQKAAKTHDAEGQRTSYFPDDHKYDLKAMFEKEKNTTVEEQLAMFAKGSIKEKLNEDFDVDDMFMSSLAPKESLEKQEERERKSAILEHQRTQQTLDNCHCCIGNKLMKKHLIVSLGSKCYVSVPYHESLTEGHCMIIPIHHVACSTRADEDLWEEVTSYRQALVQMFNAFDKDCVFLEMATRLRNHPHMVIQCIPLPREVGDLAPIYFKKAIDECDEEWAQNKKLVDLKGRNVRKAVPKGLPYFWVDFGLSPGYAHVIENELKFKKNFGLEIIGGMIDADISRFRKPKPENFDTQRQKVLQLAEMFRKFDPTA